MPKSEKSEIVKRAKKKKLIRECISFAKFLIFVVTVGGILILYKNDNVDFSKIIDSTLSFTVDTLNSFRDNPTKENQYSKSNEDIAEVENKKVVCVDPTQINKENQHPISNEKTANSAENLDNKSANFANDLKEPAEVAEKSSNNGTKKKTPRKVQYVSDDDIVSEEIAVTPQRPFKYGLANRVDNYSWNIDIEPYQIAEGLKQIHRDNNWIYKTDDLNYNTKELVDVVPNLKTKSTKKLCGEWNESVRINSNKIVGGFLNEMPYKFVGSGKLKNEVKAPSFTKEVQLSLTYAPELAVPFAEMDLLFSEPKRIQNKLERLAFAYLRAGEKEKLENLLEQKTNFVYPKVDWGILEKHISDDSFGINDIYDTTGLTPRHINVIRRNKQKEKVLIPFNKSVILRKQRDYYLKLIRGKNILAKSYGRELEKSNKFSKKHYAYINMLYSKKGQSLTFNLKEKDIEELNNYFDVIKKRIDMMKLKVVDRYNDFTDDEVKEEFKHLNRTLGRFSFFTVDMALYILCERKISDYIISPQSLLYVTVQLYREYKQKYRAISMLFWIQKSAMNSPLINKNALYHDYFNAMETTIYMYKYMKSSRSLRYFRKEENFKHLRKLMHNSLKLAHDPLAEKYFIFLWQHRYMVISFFSTNCWNTGYKVDSIPILENIVNNPSRHKLSYLSMAKHDLALCYFRSNHDYAKAEQYYTDLVEGIGYSVASPARACIYLEMLANETNNKPLWDKTQKIAKKHLSFAKQLGDINALKEIINGEFKPKIKKEESKL